MKLIDFFRKMYDVDATPEYYWREWTYSAFKHSGVREAAKRNFNSDVVFSKIIWSKKGAVYWAVVFKGKTKYFAVENGERANPKELIEKAETLTQSHYYPDDKKAEVALATIGGKLDD